MGNPLKRKKALKIELMKQAAGLQTPAQEEVAPQPEPVVVEAPVVETATAEEVAAAPAEEASPAPEGEVRTSKYKRKVQ
jgi:hypothetical protein